MTALLIAGLASFLKSAPPAPVMPVLVAPMVAHAPFKISRPGTHDFAGKIYSLGTIPSVVKEYGVPVLQVFVDGATVRHFAWRGSMEALHVGTQAFTGTGMRQRHGVIHSVLEQLWCDDIGEDCISIQPRAVVTLRDSQFQGRYGLVPGEGENPGQDKMIQIDGATVTIENCDFYHGLSPIRAKANSTVYVRHCRFVGCGSCVSGDGLKNPAHKEAPWLPPYDNGQPGPCHIVLEDCACWHCGEVARAFPGCTIELRRVKLYATWRMSRRSGGTVIVP